ncbi:ANTAR domain-containing response regulator [Agrobacterium sp. NPDC090283]|uniref:ANTAR domain-containing response regulator n=1 Tax=Agrobacterium sp. NPDC090283 TaxID=3363920 RepID=UPI00383ABE96
MRPPRLSDLNGIRVGIFLPHGAESHLLTEHLRRIGCFPSTCWPPSAAMLRDLDIGIVSVDPEFRDQLRLLGGALERSSPPLIAIAGYEDPSTLQVIMELHVAAVIERPLKPFGLLTNLMIARESRRHKSGEADAVQPAHEHDVSMVALAKVILQHQADVSSADAHKLLQRKAMNGRITLNVAAKQVIGMAAGGASIVGALSQLLPDPDKDRQS